MYTHTHSTHCAHLSLQVMDVRTNADADPNRLPNSLQVMEARTNTDAEAENNEERELAAARIQAQIRGGNMRTHLKRYS